MTIPDSIDQLFTVLSDGSSKERLVRGRGFKHVIDFIAITSMQAIDLTADSPIDLGD